MIQWLLIKLFYTVLDIKNEKKFLMSSMTLTVTSRNPNRENTLPKKSISTNIIKEKLSSTLLTNLKIYVFYEMSRWNKT